LSVNGRTAILPLLGPPLSAAGDGQLILEAGAIAGRRD
jgi:hypothetical protein